MTQGSPRTFATRLCEATKSHDVGSRHLRRGVPIVEFSDERAVHDVLPEARP